MILGKVISGPWDGAGLGSYSEGSDFNCNSTICYGITKAGEQKPGAVHQTFLNLQRAINRWSGAAKFTPIAVDGFIGHSTVTALQKAGAAALSVLPAGFKQVAQAMFAQTTSKESAAISALKLTESLNSAADKREAAGTLPAPLPTPSFPPVIPPPSSSSDASPTTTQPRKSNMLYWLLGGFAVVATAGIATAVVMKRKKAQPGRKAPRYRRAGAY